MKKMIVCFIVSLFLLFGVPTLSNAQMEDGTYSLQYQVNKPGTIDASIANDYFLKPAKLFVENGAMRVQLTVKNSAWVTEFNGQNGGNSVISRNPDADTRVVQFNVASLNSPTVVKMKVDIADLNYHHEYSTDFVWNAASLQLIEAAKKPETSNNTTVQNTQAAQKPATNNAQQVAEQKAKTDAAAKAAEEKAKAEAAAKAAEEEVKAEAKAVEEESEAEAEEKTEAAAGEAEKNKQSTEEREVGATESQQKELASAATSSTEPAEEKSSGLMWIFIIVGLIIIGGATAAIMKKRAV